MTFSPLVLVLGGWLLMAVIMVVLWFVAQRHRDAGIVDVGWAAGLGILPLLYAALGSGYAPRKWLVAALACLWAWRLAYYLLVDRVLRASQEDGRYQNLRRHWGDRAPRNFFIFFQVQASWDALFSIPMVVAVTSPAESLGVFDWLGVVIIVTAIVGESIADRQLARFRRDPANQGRTCREGLWRYSRHPNYFFEWLHWWAYVSFAASSPYWWVTLAGPVLMLAFLFKITGIPYTEAQAIRSRGEDYRRYQQTTSVFIPWFPKKEQS